MKIIHVSVLQRSGETDIVLLKTDLPSGIWPYEGGQVFKTEISQGNGAAWAAQCFPGFVIEVIDARGKKP